MAKTANSAPKSLDSVMGHARVVSVAEHAAIQPELIKRLGVWFMLLSLLIASLVMVGGIVRISGSGLSIPEWPIINGSLLPPLTHEGWQTVYRTYYRDIHDLELQGSHDTSLPDRLSLGRFQLMFAIEYTHRLLAAVVGMLFLALLVQCLRNPSLRPKLGRRLSAAAVLLLAQAILGGIVVKLDLKAEFVAVHLGMAFIFFAIIFWTALQLIWPPPMPHTSVNGGQRLLLHASLIAIFLQILGGGLVAGTHAGYIYNTWPQMGDGLVPENILQHQVLIQFIHRWWAVVAVASVLAVVVGGIRTAMSDRARLLNRAVASLVVLQFLLGIMTLITSVPAVLALSHLMLGFALFALLVWLSFEYKYHGVC